MSLLDIICDASEALDLYRNFSCNSQNLEGFKRCYDYASGNTNYYDNGYDDNKYTNIPSSMQLSDKKRKTYSTDYLRYYYKRKKNLKIGEYTCLFGAIISLFGVVISAICLIVLFNWTSFIVLISFLFVEVLSLVIGSELTDKIFLESNPSIDVWLREHPEFK
jgi:hypothetical protein